MNSCAGDGIIITASNHISNAAAIIKLFPLGNTKKVALACGVDWMVSEHVNEHRSYNMSRIRSINTKPEIIVRKYLFSLGLRYRKNDKRYPGCPDIVLPKYKTIIFVNGCFWHMHEGCSYFTIPKTRQDYWINKLQRNKRRDIENISTLIKDSWKVIVVWECELKNASKRKERFDLLFRQITESNLA